MMDAWGKFESSDCFHRLEHHCADVAACFEALLAEPVLRTRFEQASGAGSLSDTTVARLTVLAFLHDFGKLNSGFQFKVRERSELPNGAPPKAGHLGEALLSPHEILETLGLFDLYRAWGDAVEPLLLAALSHHGRPARKPTHSGSGPPEIWKPFAGYDPRATAALLRERTRAWFPEAFEEGPLLPEASAFAHLFAGVVALADQIGSDDAVFPLEPDADPRYIGRARRIAKATVKSKGFQRADCAVRAGPDDVGTLFAYEQPRPAQIAVAEAPLDQPLLILESETGSGKTEAAILRFVALWRAGLVDGLYFAVPTRAAAKQLHGRVCMALDRFFPADARVQTVLAIPGYHVAGRAGGQRVGRFAVFWEDEPDEETRLARWSAESTRTFLSATAAVGTVDQALLAGLQVKWAHLRAAALSRSLLVVDEVHASDAYMTELVSAVLRGHLQLGGHALLMSATLGASARTVFAAKGARIPLPAPTTAEAVPYPALVVAGRRAPETRAIPVVGRQKVVSISTRPVLGESAEIVELALSAARDGAKVLVIRNTVTSAQAVFSTLLDRGGGSLALEAARKPALHHSRFAVEDRRLLDDAVERALGKDRVPGGVVVIGTQTLEQSLDIDADYLITDLCPVDVLLQRIGRLHRHGRSDRPARFSEPGCVVLVPETGLESGLDGQLLPHGLGLSDRGGVYRDLLGLEATRRLIEDHQAWTIPKMNRMLVEGGTHPEILRNLAQTLGESWVTHEGKTFGLRAAEAKLARSHALTRTETFNENLAFPDLDEHVRTRLGEDGPRIVLVDPVPGPFGRPVQTFNVPAHLFRPVPPGKEEIKAARAEPKHEGLILHVGHYKLTYDRLGIRQTP